MADVLIAGQKPRRDRQVSAGQERLKENDPKVLTRIVSNEKREARVF